MKLLEYLLALMVGTSFISRRVLLDRITAGDLIAAVAIVLMLLIYARRRLIFVDTAYGGLLMLATFSAGLVMSARKTTTLIEIVILTFLFFSFLALINIYKGKSGLDKLLKIVLATTFLGCIIGFWDLIADFSSLPRIFEPRYMKAQGYYVYGELTSGMRNAGQAGAYMLVVFLIIYPLRTSSLINEWSSRQRFMLSVTIILALLFVLLTAKIAAYIGLVLGVIFNIFLRRDVQIFKPVLLLVAIIFALYGTIEAVAPRVIGRIEFKVRTRILEKVIENSDTVDRNGGDFQSTNYTAAFQAFKDNPFTASGIGAFSGVYHSHEVHSTPLKLVGETGLLGIFGYSAFMLTLFLKFRVKSYSQANPYRSYLYAMYPFFLGAFVSWGYTYHLRKREFWIAAAVITIAHQCMVQWEKKQNETKIKACLD